MKKLKPKLYQVISKQDFNIPFAQETATIFFTNPHFLNELVKYMEAHNSQTFSKFVETMAV